MRDNPSGFRPDRCTTVHLLAFWRIVEAAEAKNLKTTMVLVDFKKAFDSVHCGLLMKILRAYGIPDMLLYATLRSFILGHWLKYKQPMGVHCTEVFDILAGVPQEDT